MTPAVLITLTSVLMILAGEVEGRGLWIEPPRPRPGDLVMFETNLEPTAPDVVLSAFGRDARMFRVGDRLRAYAAVPLDAKPVSHAARLWLSDRDVFRCLDVVVQRRDFQREPRLTVGIGPLIPEQDGAWVVPLEREPFALSLFLWPRQGQVRSGFGVGRTYSTGGRASRHMGVDITGETGERVFATQAGQVRFSGRLRATGDTLVIDHGGGLLSYYMHLSSRLKRAGDRVRQGEIIAHVGSTGRVTGPHLHFAASAHQRFIDPESLLAHPLFVRTPSVPCAPEPSAHSAR